MLRFEHVTKTFGRRRVLDDVDLILGAGTFNLLVGPNGSGKTTLLRLLATLTSPTSGTVHWSRADASILDDPAQVRGILGYAGHTPLVYDELTVEENIESLLLVRGKSPNEAREATTRWTQRFGLIERGRDRADALSRGLRQRLALAQAFSHEPSLLLLDEPGSNLDEGGLETLLEVLRERRAHTTTVLATHEPDPFRPLADRVLEVDHGKIRDWGAK